MVEEAGRDRATQNPNHPMSTPVQLTTIHLVGSLGKAIGHTKLTLDVRSTAEAIRAIDILTRGKLTKYLRGPGKDRLYRIALDKKVNVIEPRDIHQRSGDSDIWIIPTVKGRDKAFTKVIIGIGLIAFAFLGGAAAGAFIVGNSGLTYGGLALGYGVSLVLGGIAQALTPRAPNDSPEAAANASKVFQGNAVAAIQGACVPIVYGRAMVSAFPVSITVENNDVSVSSAGNLGEVITTNLEGGGVQYEPDTDSDDLPT